MKFSFSSYKRIEEYRSSSNNPPESFFQRLPLLSESNTFSNMGLFKKKFTLVVACKANITRSAYLHGYMEYYLKEHLPYSRKKVQILSAGVKARQGGSASQVVKHVARVNGFSLSNHRSDPFTKKLIKQADVILVMEQWQKDSVLERFPAAQDKTFLLMEYLWHGDEQEIRDIPDPTGQNLKDYEEFMNVAHSEVDRIFRELGREDIV
jgi:protein-tyrosine-phosphatase